MIGPDSLDVVLVALVTGAVYFLVGPPLAVATLISLVAIAIALEVWVSRAMERVERKEKEIEEMKRDD